MRTWNEVERSLSQMLAKYNGAETNAMRGFLQRASENVEAGKGDERCGNLYERLLCEHEERVFRAMGVHP